MYKTRTRHSSSWQKLMCRWFGHQMTDGLKYHTATKRGCPKVCQRCGFYDVLEETIDSQSPTGHTKQLPSS